MRLSLCSVTLAVTLSSVCLAQPWELGASGGYGWYHDPSIANASGSAQAGMPSRAAFGMTFTQNMYNYVGGEIRYLFRFGGPQLKSSGVEANQDGHTNLVTYDFLFYTSSKESRIRPYVAGGAGIKVYTGLGPRFPGVDQPLANFALLRPVNQVEPAISVGGGVKFLMPRRMQLRVDFRAYMTPLPDQLFRPVGLSVIRGWLYDFVPLGGISYVF
jgi:opacity protein-like surface antigen